jgi:predicted Zn-ribbon and HTH transcriptional regulator
MRRDRLALRGRSRQDLWMPRRRRGGPSPEPIEEADTRRGRIAVLLRDAEWPADELAAQLDIDRADLEAELEHLDRSARRRGEKLAVTPARCLACDAVLKTRSARPFHAPRRCPSCKEERMSWPRYRLVGGR